MSTPCLGAPAYLFFPEDEDPTTPAPDLCLTCPSSLTCLQSGWTETWGAWGGLARGVPGVYRVCGRPKHVSDQAVLAAWVALAIDLRPMIVIDMADLIATADADTLRDLGVVPGAIRPDWYSRVWRSLHSVLDLIDSHPIRPELGGDRRTKMTKAEFDALLARRDPEETAHQPPLERRRHEPWEEAGQHRLRKPRP